MYNIWYLEVLAVFSVGVSFESCNICKNNDHACLLHSNNTCRVHWVMFEHLA